MIVWQCLPEKLELRLERLSYGVLSGRQLKRQLLFSDQRAIYIKMLSNANSTTYLKSSTIDRIDVELCLLPGQLEGA